MSLRRSRITTVNLTQLCEHDPENRDKLESLYVELDMLAQIRNEKQRLAAEAAAEFQIAAAQEQMALVKFLRFGSTLSSIIATESNWMLPVRNSEGHVTLSNPMTRKDQQMAARVAHRQMTEAAEGEDEPMDFIDEAE